MSEPTVAQMEALERTLSRRRGLRQELDEIRNVHHDIDPPASEDSDDWLESEYPIIIDIMRDAVRAVLDAS